MTNYILAPLTLSQIELDTEASYTPEEIPELVEALNEMSIVQITTIRKRLLAGESPVFTSIGIVNKDNPNEILTDYIATVTSAWTENGTNYIATTAGHTINTTITVNPNE